MESANNKNMRKKDQWRICDIYSGKSRNFNLKTKRSSGFRFDGLLKGGFTVLISVLIIFTVVKAGSLTPSASPAATMNSLADIAGSGFATATHSLKALYDKINSLAADIWNKQTSELTTSGSVGKLFVDNVDTTISSRLAAVAYVTERGTDNAALASNYTAERGAKLDNLDAAISSRSPASTALLNTTWTDARAVSLDALAGTYDASGVSANAVGDVMEQLKYIRQNFSGAGTCATSGYSCLHYGNNDASYVLTTAGGTYNATFLTAANVRSGVAFGVSSIGAYTGGTLAYGSNNAAKVLTTADVNDGVNSFNAENLISVGMVKSGVQFGVGPLTGAYPSATYTLPSADGGITDLAATSGNISSSNGSVEWWQSDGTRQTATLNFPAVSSVCSNATVNNSAGTLSVTAAYISVGNTYCSTAGTLLANLFNGTSGSFTGGSQANGGADDYNNGGSPASGRYAMGWTACNAGNSYCGTSDTGADAKDDSTGLIWSMPCNGSGCASFSDATPLTYSWDSSAVNNNSRTASQLCSDHAGWSLPHQKQLMQAYIDGSYGNLEDSGVNRNYWSATTKSNNTASAWYTYLSRGYTDNDAKTNSSYVRCVR